MSPEDEARGRLLAHYERLGNEAALRTERLRRSLASTFDDDEADRLRDRIEHLRASTQEMLLKADAVRALIESGL